MPVFVNRPDAETSSSRLCFSVFKKALPKKCKKSFQLWGTVQFSQCLQLLRSSLLNKLRLQMLQSSLQDIRPLLMIRKQGSSSLRPAPMRPSIFYFSYIVSEYVSSHENLASKCHLCGVWYTLLGVDLVTMGLMGAV